MLRLATPTANMWRVVKEDAALGGGAIPKGSFVERLLARLPGVRLAPGQTLRHPPNVLLRGLESLRLDFDPA